MFSVEKQALEAKPNSTGAFSPLTSTRLFPAGQPGRALCRRSLGDEAVGLHGLPHAFRVLFLPGNPYSVNDL